MPGFKTFSNGLSWVCRATRPNPAQGVSTVNGRWANSPEWRPSADIQCVPGTAAAGTRSAAPEKDPVALVSVTTSSVVSR